MNSTAVTRRAQSIRLRRLVESAMMLAIATVLGIVLTFLVRLGCHYVSGVVVWEVLWPNELGWAAPIWSIAYNASYMIPEIIITSLVAALSYGPLKKYYQGQDLN